MHLHGSWGVRHALALGLVFHCRSGEGFGMIPTWSRSRSQRTTLSSSASPVPPSGSCGTDQRCSRSL